MQVAQMHGRRVERGQSMVWDHEVGKRSLLSRVGAMLLAVMLCAGLVPAAASSVAFADEVDAEVVRIGYYEQEVFEEGASEGECKTGYAYEYYRKISEYTGWKYEYVYGDFSELYQMLLDGDIDVIAGLAWREDREGLIGYPQEPMGNESYNLVKHSSDDSITADPSTLEGARIGVLDSAIADVLRTYLAEHDVTAEVVTFSDNAALFEAFDAHEIDVLAAEGDGAYGRSDAEVTTAFGASDYFLCVSITRPDLLDELNAAQAQLFADEPDYLSTLHAKYYPMSVSSRAFSPAEKEWLAEHDTLIVGYLNNYLPYSGTDENGEPTGLVVELTPQLFSSLHVDSITIEYRAFDGYEDMIAAMNAGEIDAAFPVGGGLYYSEENGIYQSSPVASTSTELVYKGEYSEQTLSRFAVNENNNMQYYYVKTNFPDAEIVFYPSIDECLHAVVSGEATATTLNGLRASDMLKNRDYSSLSMRQLAQTDDRCYGVQIGNEGLLKLLNRGISVMGTDHIEGIASRYTDQLYSYSFWDLLMDNIGYVIAPLLAVVALIVFLVLRDSRRTKRQKEELAAALSAAENANIAKTTFLHNMSHDIRTPMNAIVGYTTLASTNLDDEAKLKDYLGKISISSDHLLALINDVLEMSRIESGKVELEETEVCLPELVGNLQTIVHANVSEKHQELIVDMDDMAHENVIADKVRLSGALLNILSNAIKFTPDGGVIKLSVAESPSEEPGRANYEFRIADNGIGMSEEFQKTVFDPFTREQTSTVSGIQGTGLGMAITKNIVDLMGGTISVESTEGEGTTFTIDVSFATCDADEDGSGAFEPSATSDAAETEPSPRGPAAELIDAEPAAEPEASPKRILLAEDNAMNQQIAIAILEDAGFTVEVAHNGEEAVEKVAAAPAGTYGVVLMDIQMPKMDGYEATKAIRALDDPDKAGIAIVAVTANAFEEDRKAALEAGMDGHLAKPYDIPEMTRVLSEIFG